MSIRQQRVQQAITAHKRRTTEANAQIIKKMRYALTSAEILTEWGYRVCAIRMKADNQRAVLEVDAPTHVLHLQGSVRTKTPERITYAAPLGACQVEWSRQPDGSPLRASA